MNDRNTLSLSHTYPVHTLSKVRMAMSSCGTWRTGSVFVPLTLPEPAEPRKEADWRAARRLSALYGVLHSAQMEQSLQRAGETGRLSYLSNPLGAAWPRWACLSSLYNERFNIGLTILLCIMPLTKLLYITQWHLMTLNVFQQMILMRYVSFCHSLRVKLGMSGQCHSALMLGSWPRDVLMGSFEFGISR